MQNGLDCNYINHYGPSTENGVIITTTNAHAEVPLETPQEPRILNSEDFITEDYKDGPPQKKRKLGESTTSQNSTPRPVSPPWKRIAVEGPSSFVEGGRRKSSRTNAVPLELQPQADKRRTRAAGQQTATVKSRYARVSAYKSNTVNHAPSQQLLNGKHSHPNKVAVQALTKPHTTTAHQKYDASTKMDIPSTPTSRRPYKKKHRQVASPSQEPTTLPYSRRSARASHVVPTEAAAQESVTNGWHASEEEEERDVEQDEEEDYEDEMEEEDVPVDPNYRPQRLKLKVRMPEVTVQHPMHVVPPRKFASFREWLEQDDPLEGSDSTYLTDKQARKEARIRQRIHDAAQPGGVLSAERCSIYVPDPQDEPSRQYAHRDHLVSHAVYFKKLMDKEHRDHVASARKLAHAAVTRWKEIQPKTDQEIEQEKLEQVKTVYYAQFQQCVQDISRKWDLFRVEVEKYRLRKWDEEQQALGTQALTQVIEQNAQLLSKRMHRDSTGVSPGLDGAEGDSDRSEGGSMSEDASDEDESEDERNMSSSQSESDDGLQDSTLNEDDKLTVDEIRRKYDKVPIENLDRPPDTNDEEVVRHLTEAAVTRVSNLVEENNISRSPMLLEEVDETLLDESDQSTDMDDDMGESDDSSEEDGSADGEEDTSEAEEENFGTHMFLTKEEREVFKRNSFDRITNLEMTNGGVMNGVVDDMMFDEEEIEEVSLVPDATQVQTPSASNSEAPSIDLRKELQHSIQQEDAQPNTLSAGTALSTAGSPHMPSTNKSSPLANLVNLDHARDVESDSMPATPVSSKPLRTPVPSLLRGTLREYQHFGLDWLAGLYANRTNGILADEMGLGKTIQTISLLAHLAVEHEIWGPHLIVVPTSVMLNWEMEFKKFLPGFKIMTYYGTQEERKQKRKGWLDDDRWNVCITSYQLVLQDQQTFKRRAWHYLVLDEAHNIKNFRSQRWQALLTFRTRARLLLTGTPLQNNLTELWSLMFFLMPSDSTETGIAGFADLQAFTSWFKKPVDQILEQGRDTMDDEAKELVKRLHGVLRPYLLRRLKADVEKQMPGKYEHVVYCKLSKRQRYLYDGFMSRTQTRETLASGNYLSIINCLMQLRKVCNHPDLFETRQIVTSFAMPKSAVADFEIQELLVRRRLLQDDVMQQVSLDAVNLLPGANGPVSALDTIQNQRLGALGRLRHLANQQYLRMLPNMQYDGRSITNSLASLDNTARTSVLERLRHCAYLTSLRSQRRPLYSYSLIERLLIDRSLPTKPVPKRRAQLIEWLSSRSPVMEDLVLTLSLRSEAMQTDIQKFACVTPAVIVPEITPLTLTTPGIESVRQAQQLSNTDAFHEPRMRLSIAFPDKRLLQYDCGKLQRLDTLLRNLQAGGHRALIFTQMTKVLDILEQFLNIHGHRYLRLDGATKIEQRQILTDRFNNDDRILVFILSSRSGGLGINLTGADTVIFYDLDWNPAMDKQCQDRCHRIGQTRDVHIYRFVSEHTIEANILRKANQKRMLDDVVIQEGDFTTDFFNKPDYIKDVFDDDSMQEGDAEASAAMDRVLGGTGQAKVSGKIFEQAEDKEDIAAAKIAEKEVVDVVDEADFDENAVSADIRTPRTPGPLTPRNHATLPSKSATNNSHTTDIALDQESQNIFYSGHVAPRTEMASEIFAEKEGIGVDHRIVEFLEWELEDIPVAPPINKIKKKAKKVGEHKIRRVR